jgi:hypothetical protein
LVGWDEEGPSIGLSVVELSASVASFVASEAELFASSDLFSLPSSRFSLSSDASSSCLASLLRRKAGSRKNLLSDAIRASVDASVLITPDAMMEVDLEELHGSRKDASINDGV